MFVPDQRANTCPVGEDCQAILYPGVQDAILFPCVTRLFTDSDCLEVLLASEGGMGRVFREQLASTCPVTVTNVKHLEPGSPFCYYTSLVALGRTK